MIQITIFCILMGVYVIEFLSVIKHIWFMKSYQLDQQFVYKCNMLVRLV